jgi:hypothetical protein
MIIHVIPVEDYREHDSTMQCWCRPDLDEEGLAIHHSMDGRESYEEGRKLQ